MNYGDIVSSAINGPTTPKVDRYAILSDELAKEQAGLQNDDPNVMPPRIHQQNILSIQRELSMLPQPEKPTAQNAGGYADIISGAINSQPTITTAAKPATPAPVKMSIDRDKSALDETALNFLTGLGSSIVGGYQGLSALAQGQGADAAANAVTKYQQEHTYQPETQGGKTGVAAMQSNYNPLNWVPNAADWAGGKVTDITGSPAAGTAVNVGVNALPAALGLREPIKALGNAADIADYTTRGAGEAPILPAASGSSAPATPIVAPAKPARATETAEAKPLEFTEPPPSTGATASPAEQAERAAVLKRIGAPDDIRQSAITGDMGSASTDLQMSRLSDDQRGPILKARLAAEREALENHAESIVENTGGTLGMDESSKLARGATILQPIDALKQWFDNETNKQYAIARERAQGQPVSMQGVSDTLNQDSIFQGNTDSLQLRKGVQARMKELGMTDEEGNLQSATVDQAENLRKYLNEQWSPKSNKAIGALKDAIDDDVTSAAGEDIFKDARALRAARGITLDDPKGIAKILDSNGPEGINRAVPVEKIADHIAALPVDQLDHIVNTLQRVPDAIQPQAQAAISEIKAHIANQALEAGNSTATQWNAKGVAKVLNKNSEKIARLFGPDEQSALQDLNKAGNILHIDASYPGAYVQQANLMKRGVMASLPAAGAVAGETAGSLFGMPTIGTGVGAAVGNSLAKGMASRAALKAVQSNTVKLSDFPNVGGR
jgi:hypothetical protein